MIASVPLSVSPSTLPSVFCISHIKTQLILCLIQHMPIMLCAMQGFDITPDLRRMCPSLTLQQIYKLSEHHHDDWITAVGDNQGTKTIVLLETLKRAVDSSGGMATPPPASPMRSTDGSQTPGGAANAYPSPASISSRHSFAEDEDNLLLDSHVGFATLQAWVHDLS